MNTIIHLSRMWDRSRKTTYNIRREDFIDTDYIDKKYFINVDKPFYENHYNNYINFLNTNTNIKDYYINGIKNDKNDYINHIKMEQQNYLQNIENYNFNVRTSSEFYITHDLLNFFMNSFNNKILLDNYFYYLMTL